jgi:hypothetical protein
VLNINHLPGDRFARGKGIGYARGMDDQMIAFICVMVFSPLFSWVMYKASMDTLKNKKWRRNSLYVDTSEKNGKKTNVLKFGGGASMTDEVALVLGVVYFCMSIVMLMPWFLVLDQLFKMMLGYLHIGNF